MIIEQDTKCHALQDRIQSGQVLILDGGLSTALEQQGFVLRGKLWTAAVLLSDPGVIRKIHFTWLESGAQIVTTSSYQASLQGFADHGLSMARARETLLLSSRLALEARNQFESLSPSSAQPLVAASIGPYGAFLADGSEYSGDYLVSEQQLEDFHAERLFLLDQSGVDVLACETIPNLLEARVLSRLLLKVKTPAWVSFCCRNNHQISDGTAVAEAAALFSKHPKVVAVGVNCTAPTHISDLIEVLRQTAPLKAIVVYPNSGECYDAGSQTWDAQGANGLTKNEWIQDAPQWRQLGASIIGGCCRTTSLEISQLARLLHS
ncbi:MAG: homocysteine S-methyltransferase [bacterium]